MGRRVVGVDINALAVFVARAKTLVLSEDDLTAVQRWADRAVANVTLHDPAVRPTHWIELGYQRNLSDQRTWRMRKWLELMLHRITRLAPERRRVFARAVILHTAQWALDCRSEIPSIASVRAQFLIGLAEMCHGARSFRARIEEHGNTGGPLFLHRSAAGMESEDELRKLGAPQLVLTSPPYPGVHVVYHRWQILGRKETPAPFWIANSLDGNGLSYYTFGDRKQPGLKNYFETARDTYSSVGRIAGPETIVVQMVAFSDPTWQLPRYLETMEEAGFQEVTFAAIANDKDGRVWRTVPNRRWYADQRGQISASNEVVLFHRKR